jgi:hypothetical protein
MRKQLDNGVWRKPSRWRRAGILATAGLLSLAGCSSIDSGTTASAPDPFLGPGVAPPPKIAANTIQPPPGTPPAAYAGVLPAAAAPNPTVSVAALAPTSVHPTGDREDLRIGAPRTVNGEGWTPTGATAVAANAGGGATLTPPETPNTPPRTPTTSVVQQNSNPPANPSPAVVQQNSNPPVNPSPAVVQQNSNPSPADVATSQPQQPTSQGSVAATPVSIPHPPQDQPPATVEAAAALLTKKGALWQRPDQNSQTGEWLFRCGIENPQTKKITTYEGRAKDQLSAMRAALDQIDQRK